MNKIDAETKSYLSNVVKCFSPGIRYACAYGSGVFKQSGHKSIKENMIDFLFVVNDAFSWHSQNLTNYSDHYSIIKHLGVKSISEFQTNYGAGVFFNTCVEFDGRLIKYGVIDLKMFQEDMFDWTDLYIAGRLQKPVYSLAGLDNPLVEKAIASNLKSAALTALLLLDEKFTTEEFFIKIASLSYTGDPRMIVGEDKGKVRNIVAPNLDKFINLYKPVLKDIPGIDFDCNLMNQNLDPFERYKTLQELPKNLNQKIYKKLNLNTKSGDIALVQFQQLKTPHIKDAIADSVAKIVRRSSTTQTLKNSVSAGVKKSVYYGGEILKKMLRGLARR